jgi:hypothetical protein
LDRTALHFIAYKADSRQHWASIIFISIVFFLS